MGTTIRLLILFLVITSCHSKKYYDIREFENIPLPEGLEKVRLIGLGESTHGTLEFATIKASIIKDLINNYGYNLLAIEANYLDTKKVNAWLNGEEGDLDKLIKGLKYWTFENYSFKDLLVWIRKYNSKADRPVNLYGIDMQYVQQSIREPFDYLKNYLMEDSLAYNHLKELDTISIELLGEKFFNTPLSEFQEIKKAIGVAQHLIDIQINDRHISADTAFWYKYNLSNALNAIEMYENDVYNYQTPDYSNVRDLSMAENSIAIIERYQDSKMILWAHNYHIKNNSNVMGGHLKEYFGSEFITFCLTTRTGHLTAYSPNATLGHLSTFDLDENYNESLEYKIWSSGLPDQFIMSTKVLTNYLDSKDSLLMLDVGAVYDTEDKRRNYIYTDLENEYEYIIYIDSTNALN